MRITVLCLLILFSKIAVSQESSKIDYNFIEKRYSKKYGGYKLDNYHILNLTLSEKEFLLNLNLKDLKKNTENDNLIHSIFDDACCDNEFLFYESVKTEDTIVLWKLDGEYYSYIYFFHYDNEEIDFLGEVNIGENCVNEGCEAFNVSKEKIHVSKKYDFISVLFKGKNTFFSKEISPNGSLTSENLTLHFRLMNQKTNENQSFY